MAQGTGGLQLQHFTGAAGPGALQSHAAPAHLNKGLQCSSKESTSLSPGWFPVSQANALNFDCEPDLCDLICARHVTPLVTALPWRTIPSLGATGRGKLEAAPFALLCWSCLSCESLLQEKHKPPMFSPGREVTEWITENRLPSFTLCLSNIMVEN